MKKDKKDLLRLITMLQKAAELAVRLGVTLGNGAEVGSLVGSIASELELAVFD